VLHCDLDFAGAAVACGRSTFAVEPLWAGRRGADEGSPIVIVEAETIEARTRNAKYGIGQVVRHRVYPFRGVIFDVDPVFANTEEWWEAIPEDVRPSKDQPFYHLYAENAESEYVAYVSEQNLLPDDSGLPLRHPQIDEAFTRTEDGHFVARHQAVN
jgi:heat shock protein HspQ